MIVSGPINQREPYKMGEEVILFLPIDDPTQEYKMTVYANEIGKFLGADFKYKDASEDIDLSNVTLSTPPGDFVKVYVNTYFMTQPDFLSIHVENKTDPTDYYDLFVQVGHFYAFVPAMINVYGYLYDSNGLPVKHEPVTFTVLNSATAFDNSPLTSMTTTVITDEQGRFEADLNRHYDYLFAVARFNYSKVIRLSEVDDSVTSVEVIIGRGLVCES